MLCDCCFKDVGKTYKIIESKDTYEKLFHKRRNSGDIDLCSWCWKTINNIDKFRRKALEVQNSFATNLVSLPKTIYNLGTKIYVDHYDKILVDEKNYDKLMKEEEVHNLTEELGKNDIFLRNNIDDSSDIDLMHEIQIDFKQEIKDECDKKCKSEENLQLENYWNEQVSIETITHKAKSKDYEIYKNTRSMKNKKNRKSKGFQDKSKILQDKLKVMQDKSKVVKDKTKVVQDKSKVVRDKTKVVQDILQVVQDQSIAEQEKSREIILHSYVFLTHTLLVTNIPGIGEKYDSRILTDEEILNFIKTTDEQLNCDNIKYKCFLCHQLFSDEQQQIKHTTLHQYKTNSVLCKFCNTWIKNDSDSVMLHYRDHYVLYNCRECTFTHNSIKEMTSHYTKCHATYKCQHCDKVFNSRGSKNYHIIKEHHGTTHQCNQCGKLFSTIISLRSHMEVHSSISYSCDICKTTFKTKASMYVHKSVKHKTSPITCEVCNKVFILKSSYKKHLEDTCNHQTERRKYKCTYCDNEYLSTDQMKKHMNFVHLGVGLVCNICGKLFQSKSVLNRHMVSHADKSGRTRDYICDHCGKAFYTKPEMKEHMNIHSDNRPFQCKLCNANFKFKAALYTHNKLVHKKLKKSEMVEKIFPGP